MIHSQLADKMLLGSPGTADFSDNSYYTRLMNCLLDILYQAFFLPFPYTLNILIYLFDELMTLTVVTWFGLTVPASVRC